ncbi:MAG: class I SAM-dependent methyltransferase [Desulfobulbaceae bacterium]|jgi:SAM-dependent methyltransferase|nr:class I SAM-dependent methyltransferase [Desulfobulbaceae bacterium]
MDDIVRQRDHFEKIAELYRQARNDPKHLLLKKYIWDIFLKGISFPAVEKLNVLEAMCGYGEFYDILQERLDKDFVFDAFDYSESMVAFAQERNPGINIWTQDVTTFCAPNSYDIICVIGGLHHVHRYIDKVLRNISLSLRSDGLFINLEPTANNPIFTWTRQAIYRKNSFFDADTERGFTTAELNKAVLSRGMRLIRQLYPGLLAYVLWYNPDALPWLNKGTSFFAEELIRTESKVWESGLARFFSFATLSCYRKVTSP